MKKLISLFLCMMPIIAFAQATNSPNMNLPIPIPGVTSGPIWAQDINASLTLIDQHNHTSGSGVQVPPAGLNMNANLPFNNNSVTSLKSAIFTPQVSYSTNYGIHVEGVDLYYVDGNGNDVQMTSGGSVNATSSGITNGTATASFVAGVLVVNSASNTPANIQGASILIGNNVANSKFLTLAPPNAMAANYQLTLPSIPASTLFTTLDSSGNFGTASSIQGTQIATGSLTGAQLANNTVTRTQLAAVGQQVSSSSSTGITSCGSAANVSNLTDTITTTGRPVELILQQDGSGSATFLGSTGGFNLIFYNSTSSSQVTFYPIPSSNTYPGQQYGPYIAFDVPAAGTYTYTARVVGTGGTTTCIVSNFKLIAYEL